MAPFGSLSPNSLILWCCHFEHCYPISGSLCHSDGSFISNITQRSSIYFSLPFFSPGKLILACRSQGPFHLWPPVEFGQWGSRQGKEGEGLFLQLLPHGCLSRNSPWECWVTWQRSQLFSLVALNTSHPSLSPDSLLTCVCPFRHQISKSPIITNILWQGFPNLTHAFIDSL